MTRAMSKENLVARLTGELNEVKNDIKIPSYFMVISFTDEQFFTANNERESTS